MPVEVIGEAGTPGASREWIDAECRLAMKHLKKVCGEPPPETELEVQCQYLLSRLKYPQGCQSQNVRILLFGLLPVRVRLG